MGTKAIFAIRSEDKKYLTRIIGMTSDGTQDNLLWLAKEIAHTAKK